MVFYGKLIGAILGLLAGGPIGAAVGALIGHIFDRGFFRTLSVSDEAEVQQIQETFYETTFAMMGYLAKADGRVSEEEIAGAEALMNRYQINGADRERAIGYFKEGSSTDFDWNSRLDGFRTKIGLRQQLANLLLEFLITIAMADGELHSAERQILIDVAAKLGFNLQQFERMLEMLTAQSHFQQNQSAQTSASRLQDAYAALGVKESDDDRTIKTAYRKLMSEHHPDKLIARGVPKEMVQMATEKSQEIQAAYELIKKSRK